MFIVKLSNLFQMTKANIGYLFLFYSQPYLITFNYITFCFHSKSPSIHYKHSCSLPSKTLTPHSQKFVPEDKSTLTTIQPQVMTPITKTTYLKLNLCYNVLESFSTITVTTEQFL